MRGGSVSCVCSRRTQHYVICDETCAISKNLNYVSLAISRDLEGQFSQWIWQSRVRARFPLEFPLEGVEFTLGVEIPGEIPLESVAVRRKYVIKYK